MPRRFGSVAVGLSLLAAGCVTDRTAKPYLTQRAFERAAATCHVIPLRVRHSLGTKVPFADYRPGADLDRAQDHTHECLADALRGYRYDFFGEEMPPR